MSWHLAVEDVVLVEEPFADAQAEIGKLDLIRVVPEPETTLAATP